MNIFISGYTGSLVSSIARELTKGNHKLVVASKDSKTSFGFINRKVVLHPVDMADNLSIGILASYKFDAAVFVSIREENLEVVPGERSESFLDSLKNTLEVCKNAGVKTMIYLSSTEVYGDVENVLEDTVPQPASVNGHTLFAGEQYCKLYRQQHGLNTIIVRVPFVYGPDEKASLIKHALQKCKNQGEVFLPAVGSRSIGFLHTNDVADFINRLVTESYQSQYPVINLSPSKETTFQDLEKLFSEYFPNVKIRYRDENLFTRLTAVQTARTVFGWVDLHSLQNDLPEIVNQLDATPKPLEAPLKRIWRRIVDAPEILKWVELILGAVLVHLLSGFVGTLIQFKYVDFRLLFVVLMGILYGMRFGIYAAVLASLSIIYTWFELKFDWALLTHNVGNWFPFVIYFTTGILVGYRRDQYETDLTYEKKQTDLIYGKYSFLHGVFTDIRALKDEFREQLIGYRDSFGRIFAITRELDELEEDVVFVKALNILHDVMQNESIAIYTVAQNPDYARLEVSSPGLNNQISRSLSLKKYPEMHEAILKGTIFQNTGLLEGYPAYAAPILDGENLAALVVIWQAEYDQFSLDFANLFRVITGLIQASLVRASLFLNSNLDKTYLSGTKVLKPKAFLDAVRLRFEMKKDGIANFQLLQVDLCGRSYEEFYSQISDKIRANDIVGAHNDGRAYILLSQAEESTVSEIVRRLGIMAETSRLISNKQINH